MKAKRTMIALYVMLGIVLASFAFVICKFPLRDRDPRAIPQPGEVPVVKSDLKNLPEGDLYVWFGHSSFMLRLDGKTVLADPALVSFSPVSFIGKAFPGTDIYRPDDLPEKIDYLLISHDHYDHLDKQTVKAIRDRVGKVVCPLGIGSILEKWGYGKDQITELNWGDAYQDSLGFHCLPTRHFSGRGLKRNPTVQASYVIESKRRQVFYSGDGGYDSERFKAIGTQFPDLDLAIMENGQYDKQWSTIHTMPEHLILEIQELSPRRFVTVHHSKVCLSRHAWDEPRLNEKNASEQSGIPVIVCKIGEILNLDL